MLGCDFLNPLSAPSFYHIQLQIVTSYISHNSLNCQRRGIMLQTGGIAMFKRTEVTVFFLTVEAVWGGGWYEVWLLGASQPWQMSDLRRSFSKRSLSVTSSPSSCEDFCRTSPCSSLRDSALPEHKRAEEGTEGVIRHCRNYLSQRTNTTVSLGIMSLSALLCTKCLYMGQCFCRHLFSNN